MIHRITLTLCAGALLAACDAPSAGDDGLLVPADIAATEAPTVVGETVPATPASLSGDERVIWNSLTPQAKRDAAAYIANGGTLTQFVAI